MANSTSDGAKPSPTPGKPSSVGTGGAAASQAPETPLRSEEALGVGRRRSDRVVLALPIKFCGTNLAGVQFTEACHTEMVSLHGTSIVLSRRASSEYPVRLRRRVLDVAVHARILGQLGIRTGFPIYGIAFTEELPDSWGISFPPLSDTNDSLARTLLKCSSCGKKIIYALNEIEFRVFDANQRLSHSCETCGRTVLWLPVPNEIKLPETGPAGAALQDRKHLLNKMKTVARIQEPDGGEEIVPVLDVSRGGIRFRGSRIFEVNCWIHFAVPYTPGAANIFVPGRIALRKDLEDGQYAYGVQYIKG
jgi:hypothetical protein